MCDGKYSALNVAKYIINYCQDAERTEITNLALQKVLYLVWIEYYRKTGEYLFNDDFRAWQLGPCIPYVYFEFCFYTANPIRKQEITVPLDKATTEIIDPILKRLLHRTAYQLVTETKRKERAWWDVFEVSPKAVIPYGNIIERDTMLTNFIWE